MEEHTFAKRGVGEFESPLLYHLFFQFMAHSSNSRTIDSQSIGIGAAPIWATNYLWASLYRRGSGSVCRTLAIVARVVRLHQLAPIFLERK